MTYAIHVVTDQPEMLEKGYLIAKLAWHWRRRGHQITAGPLRQIDPRLDLAILHFDCTRISPETLPANPSHRPFLNSKVLDISKRGFSTARVLPGDEWTGPVIVKSNLNYFGEPEWGRSQRHSLIENFRRRLAQSHWQWAHMLPPGRYPVLPSRSVVPGWVWRHPELIVERFIPEREDDLYCVRGWVFFGAGGYAYRMFSTEPIVKVDSIVRYELLGEPPKELVAIRAARGWDFGKFDYVEVAGRPVLLDMNKTPWISSEPDTPRMRELAAALDPILEPA
jgi:hypothetical protein